MSVSDTGEGIPKDERSIIFDRFSQADIKMTRASESSGIGLSWTKSLVQLLGGSISVVSEVGKGSTFTVLLPVMNEKTTGQVIDQRAMPLD